MKFRLILFIFFISSILLVVIAVERKSQTIYHEQIKETKLSTIQSLSAKTYRRVRKTYVPERSFSLARQEIKKVLVEEPIHFELNNSSSLVTSTLIKIVKIVNHVKEDVVLSILAHTDAEGTAKHNLYLSQQRADRLKEYFLNRTNLPLVVAIGYGESFSLENRLIEINLKRIKQ
jgi:outer membrane protein OmpA-like peptidoglycan-associated protein